MEETKLIVKSNKDEDGIDFGSYSLTIIFRWKDKYLDIINRRTNK